METIVFPKEFKKVLNLNTGLNTNRTSTNNPVDAENKKPEDKKQEELLIAPGSLGSGQGDVFVPSSQSTDTDNNGVGDRTLVVRDSGGAYDPGQLATIEARVVNDVISTLEGDNTEKVVKKEVEKEVSQTTASVIESETEKADLSNNQTFVLSNAALYAKIAEAMVK